MTEQPTPSPATTEVSPETSAATPSPATTEVSPETSAAAPAAAYPFSVLRVLGTALHVTKRNLLPFLVLACVLETGSILLQLAVGLEDALFAFMIQQIVHSLTSAVVAYGVIMELYGSRPSTRVCITVGFSQLGRVLGVSLVSTLAILGATLLLIVPGVIVALMLYVIVPVTVVEQVSITAAMKRSRELTHGRKGALFLIIILAVLFEVAVELVAHYELGPQAAFVWRAAAEAVSTMFFSVSAAVAYVVLRQVREGTQVPELATAFARIRK